MFSSDNPVIMISGILIAIIFISIGVYFVNKLFSNSTQDILVRFILMVFASLVGVFIVDKIIAFKTPLLSEEQNGDLFDLIKTLTLMIFSYYFGSQKGQKEEKC
jgi:purine-cytosine permease-like protein